MPQVIQPFPAIQSPLVDKNGVISLVWLRLFQTLWTRTGSASGDSNVPTGTVAEFAGQAAPAGWSICDGTELSRTENAALYQAIGTAWGSGNGSTTFNKPNFLNVFRRGSTLAGETGGSDDIHLDVPNIPSHTHDFTGASHTHTVIDPGHVHTVTDPGHTHTDGDSTLLATATPATTVVSSGSVDGATGSAVTGVTVDSAVTGITLGDTVIAGTIGDTGEGEDFSILPAYITTIPIIKL